VVYFYFIVEKLWRDFVPFHVPSNTLNELDRAGKRLKKATNLAQQLRDPSLGVISFNRAIVLHNLHKNKEAKKIFPTRKKICKE